MDQKTVGMEQRMARIEGTVGQMDKRLNHFGDELRDIRQAI